MARIRGNFVQGSVSNDPLTSGGTSLTSAGLADLPVVSAPDVAIIVLDPDAAAGDPEIVYVTAHTSAATTATISRGQDSTVARQHASGTTWRHAAVVSDFDDVGSLTAGIQRHVESTGARKSLCALGGSVANHAYADNELVGLGFVTVEAGSADIDNDPSSAGWQVQTGATSGSHVGFNGPLSVTSMDWTLVGRLWLDSAADQLFFIGAKPSIDSFADENDIIGFRANGVGNMFGVCDSGGTETVRDSGATKAGAWHAFRIEVREGGTIVRFYIDGVQIGADVTTNIPLGGRNIACGITNSAAANKRFFVSDLYYWEEA